MSRRRRYRPRVRDISGLLVLASAGWGWTLAHLAGFLALGAAAALTWPLLVLGLLIGPQAALYGCIPRRWRVRYRKRHGRAGARSAYIPQWMRRAVYRADRYRCVHCQSVVSLQWDHRWAWACGGPTSLANGFTLCQPCNYAKGCYYPPWDGFAQPGAGIMASERHTLRRWLRMAYAL